MRAANSRRAPPAGVAPRTGREAVPPPGPVFSPGHGRSAAVRFRGTRAYRGDRSPRRPPRRAVGWRKTRTVGRGRGAGGDGVTPRRGRTAATDRDGATGGGRRRHPAFPPRRRAATRSIAARSAAGRRRRRTRAAGPPACAPARRARRPAARRPRRPREGLFSGLRFAAPGAGGPGSLRAGGFAPSCRSPWRCFPSRRRIVPARTGRPGRSRQRGRRPRRGHRRRIRERKRRLHVAKPGAGG
jgi:hypothetical protein